MCKEMLSTLLGGKTTAPPVPAQPIKQVKDEGTGAQVQDTNVVQSTGQDTGRIKLGRSGRRGEGAAVGLSI